MRIALRTSGGRGEYELAGHQSNIGASDLLGRRLTYQLTPDLVLDGLSRAEHVQGKPRIRLEEGGSHIYRVLADVFLLPLPRRELREAPTGRTSFGNGALLSRTSTSTPSTGMLFA